MRNDVKLGFAIGGVLLAVLIVYVLVVPAGTQSGRKVSQQGQTATVAQAEPGKITLEPAPSAVADATTQSVTPTADQAADSGPTDPFAPKSAPSAGSAVVQGPQNTDLDWNKLLNEQPVLMIDTPVSTAAKPSAASAATPALAAPIAPLAKPSAAPSALPSAPAPLAVQSPTPVSISEPLSPPTTRPTGAVASGKTHKIAEGETLSSISTAVYGNPNQYPAILKANPGLDPTRMRVGQTINLPDLKAERAGDAVAQPAAGRLASTLDASKEYRVAAGDSLHRISQKLYGDIAHAEKIFELNKQTMGDDRHRLKIGQVIQLPEPPSVAQAPATGQ